MSNLKIFISYQMKPDERILAWRLQTLAASYEITAFVPPPDRKTLTEEVQAQIRQSDAILAFIMHPPSKAVLQEIQYAQSLGRTVIAIARKGVNVSGMPKIKVFEFDPQQPLYLLEKQIFQFLKTQQKKTETTNLIGGLTILGLILLLLYAFTKK